jgi:PAS domain S-box-containing protein
MFADARPFLVRLPLRRRLLAIALIAILPAFGIIAYNAVQLRQAMEADTREGALRAAQAGATEIERILEGVSSVLIAVGEAPAVQRLDPEACNGYLARLRASVPHLATIAVIDLEGTVRCRDSPSPANLNFSDRGYFREALRQGRFVVGEYLVGQVTRRPILTMATPLRDGAGRATGVVATGLELDWLGARLRERGVPRGGSLTVADRNGVIVSREPQPERFVGTRVPSAFQHLLEASEPGTVELNSQDGTRRILGYVPVSAPPLGIYVSAGLSYEETFGPIDRVSLWSFVLIAAGAALALLATWYAGYRFVQRPMDRLLAATASWRDGRYDLRTGMDERAGEIETVGAALDRMMDELARRDAERETQAARLRVSEERLRLAQDSGGIGVWSVDLADWSLTGSPRLSELWGLAPDHHPTVAEIVAGIHPEDRAAVEDILARVARGELDRYETEFRVIRPDGTTAWLAGRGEVQRDETGKPVTFSGVNYDITKERALQDELRAKSYELETVLATVPAGVWFTHDPEVRHVRRNRYAAELLGLPADEGATDRSRDLRAVRLLRDGRELPRDELPLQRARRGERLVNEEHTLVFPDGETKTLLSNGGPLLDADGNVIGGVLISLDISSRKRVEEHRDLLIDELNHRVKNTLAVVQAIAAQTLGRGQVSAEVRENLMARLRALADVHGVLTERERGEADLREVVEAALRPYADARDRIVTEGPSVSLGGRLSLALAMVLHELMTNAIKYGALSTGDGRVSLTWSAAPTPGGRRLALTWRESGGPPVTAPGRRGFGARLIERGLAAQPGGSAQLRFEPSGLVCELQAFVAADGEDATPAPAKAVAS